MSLGQGCQWSQNLGMSLGQGCQWSQNLGMSLPSEADEAHGHAHSSGEDMPGCDGGVFWSEQAVEDEGDGVGEDQQENVAYLRKEVGRETVFKSEWPNSLAN